MVYGIVFTTLVISLSFLPWRPKHLTVRLVPLKPWWLPWRRTMRMRECRAGRLVRWPATWLCGEGAARLLGCKNQCWIVELLVKIDGCWYQIRLMDADMKSYRSYFKCIADNMLNVNWIVDNYVKKNVFNWHVGWLFILFTQVFTFCVINCGWLPT